MEASHHLVMFCVPWSTEITDITYLICHVNLGSCAIQGGNPCSKLRSRQV